MSEESLERARLREQLREAHSLLTRLEAERLRLARKNEVLCEALLAVRDLAGLSEPSVRAIERALAFDGQPWNMRDLEPDFEDDGEHDAEDDGEDDSDHDDEHCDEVNDAEHHDEQ